MKALLWRKMNYSYFDSLEARILFSQNTRKPLVLSKYDETILVQTVFDYERCRTDFDLTCRYINIFSSLVSRIKYNHTNLAILSHLFILSTFLKNRISSKISDHNISILKKALNFLDENFSTVVSDSMLYNFDTDLYDSSRLIMALTFINIYDSSAAFKKSALSPLIASYFRNVDSVALHLDSTCKYFAVYSKNLNFMAEAFEFSTESQFFSKIYSGQPLRFKKIAASIRTFYLSVAFIAGMFIILFFLK